MKIKQILPEVGEFFVSVGLDKQPHTNLCVGYLLFAEDVGNTVLDAILAPHFNKTKYTMDYTEATQSRVGYVVGLRYGKNINVPLAMVKRLINR